MAAVTRVPITPEVLTWARTIAGYDVEALAKALGVKPDRVQEWEGEGAGPTSGQLRKVARLLRRTPAFFLRSEPPEPDLPTPPDFRRLEVEADTSVELRRDLRSASERRNRYLDLAGPVPAFTFHFDLDDVERASQAARDRLGFSVDEQIGASSPYLALRLWINAVEAQNVIVFQSTAFSLSEARGASLNHDQLPIILINAKDPIAARSFTLLHELGHLAMGSGALCEVYGQNRRVETTCNKFAAAVLMPAEAFVAEWDPDLELAGVARLARRFKVSEEAAAIRLFDLGQIGRSALNTVRAETRMRVQRQEEADANSNPIVQYPVRRMRDLGRNYVGAVLEAYHDDRIGLTDVSQYLDMKVQHIPRMEELLQPAAGETA